MPSLVGSEMCIRDSLTSTRYRLGLLSRPNPPQPTTPILRYHIQPHIAFKAHQYHHYHGTIHRLLLRPQPVAANATTTVPYIALFRSNARHRQPHHCAIHSLLLRPESTTVNATTAMTLTMYDCILLETPHQPTPHENHGTIYSLLLRSNPTTVNTTSLPCYHIQPHFAFKSTGTTATTTIIPKTKIVFRSNPHHTLHSQRHATTVLPYICLLYTSPSPRD